MGSEAKSGGSQGGRGSSMAVAGRSWTQVMVDGRSWMRGVNGASVGEEDVVDGGEEDEGDDWDVEEIDEAEAQERDSKGDRVLEHRVQ